MLIAWRNSALTLFARISLILVLPIVLLSMIDDLNAGRFALALLGPISYVLVIIVAFWQRPRPEIRAAILSLTGYTMGVILFSLGGFVTAGSTLLLMASVFGALMLSRRFSLLFAATSTVTILLMLKGVMSGQITFDPEIQGQPNDPILLLTNGLLLIYVIWFLMAAILSLLSRLNESLRATEAANASLERRVAERTAELEAALSENRTVAEQLRLILRTIPEQFWLKDQDGRYVLVSDALARFHNLPPETIFGRTAQDLYQPEIAVLIENSDQKAVQDRHTSYLERQIADYRGQQHWFESSRTPLFNPDGALVGIVGIARDITARKAAETALARQLRYAEALAHCSRILLTYTPTAEGYQAVLEQALQILRAAVDSGRIAVYCYPGWEQRLTALPTLFRILAVAHAPDLPPQRPATPEVALDFPDEINALMAAGGTFNGPARFPNNPIAQAYNDSNGVLSVCFVPLFVGGKWWGHMSLSDYRQVRSWDDAALQLLRTAGEMIVTFTRGWEAAQALSASEQRYRTLINVLPDTALLLFAPDLRFTLATGPALAATGLVPSDIEGRTVTEITRFTKAPAFVPLLQDALAGLSRQVEQSFNGRIFDVHILPLHGSGEQISGGMLVARDISLSKEVEQTLRRAAEAAAAADRAKSSFLAMMSHEIRTPLNAVLGMTSLLLDSDLSPDQREFATVINSSSAALLALINDILDISRIEAGQITFEHRPFELNHCLQESLSLVAQAAADKGLALTTSLDPARPRLVAGDMPRLRQILVNLLSNAVKFTDQGEVTLQVRMKPVTQGGKEVVAGTDEHASFILHPSSLILFEVRDTGIGISPSEQERIFQPFVQADSSATRRHGGSGLGLAISRQLAELMGGGLTVSSAPGLGTTFSLSLPLPVSDAAPTPALQAPPEPVTATLFSEQLRLLIVEDNPINQRVILLLSEKLGLQPDLVADGVAAVAAVSSKPYDVVLMDVQMPQLDGEGATRQIRARGDTIHQPYIIALTAHAFAENREQALAAGMDAYLTKPVQLDALRDALAQATGQNRSYALSRNPATAPVDWQVIGELLNALSDSPDEAKMLVGRLFHNELRNQVTSLIEALNASNKPLAARLAHTLAGASNQIGAVALAELARQAERCLRGESNGPCLDLSPQLEAAYQEADACVMKRFTIA